MKPAIGKHAVPKIQRCAIYTRKSTDHNLDLAFNSLDAQREACEAYIKSQAHEGWKLVPDRFDDGAFSGASLIRPALQILLEQVREKKIDIIVVYKVDRLTRALADFAKLVELFDANDVSFVSVTQSFNTTSSMGRLTLNVLLSFAQFEREVIGERVRDKISASKRKGIWVGGPVPLGYRSVDKKLEVVPEEAALVKKIFEDYLRLRSIGALSASLAHEGVKPKPRQLANGRTIAAARYTNGPLGHMLKNRFYIGEVAYHGEIYKGEHEAILDRILFDAVQQGLADRTVERGRQRSGSQAILTGLIFDDRGNTMSPVHANKKGVRYRYYVSQAIQQNRKEELGSVGRVSAPDVELLVCKAVRDAFPQDGAIVDRELVRMHVARIVVCAAEISITLKSAHDEPEQDDVEPPDVDGLSDEQRELTISFVQPHLPTKGIAHAPNNQGTIDPKTRDTLLQAIARSRTWMDSILGGRTKSFDEIAAAENLAERHVLRLAPLAFLSPKIVQAIADGMAPAGLTVTRLTASLPHEWSAQEEIFRIC
jgi:site-specific DNA recombinase